MVRSRCRGEVGPKGSSASREFVSSFVRIGLATMGLALLFEGEHLRWNEGKGARGGARGGLACIVDWCDARGGCV